MKTILFVGNLSREDYLSQFEETSKNHQVVAINTMIDGYVHDKLKNRHFLIYHWFQFYSVQQILKRFKPDVVVSLHIENYTEVLLKLACFENNTPFYLIDHGFYYKKQNSKTSKFKKPRFQIAKRKTPFTNKLKYKLFVALSKYSLKKEQLSAFNAFKSITKNPTVDKKEILANLLKKGYRSFHPSLMLHYSEYNRDVVNYNYNLEEFQLKYKLIGLPYFDKYFTASLSTTKTKKCFIIDQPTVEFDKIMLYNQVTEKLIQEGFEVYIKMHPYSNMEDCKNIHSSVKQIDNIDTVVELFPEFDLCIGFFSTLMLPFLSNPNCKVFSYIHGDMSEYNNSHFFVKNKLAQQLKIETLAEDLEEELIPNQDFLNDILYKIDGNSGQRLAEILSKA